MSKRVILITVLGILLVGFLVFINFGKNLPLLVFFEPVFTEEIPEKRPPRLDRRELVRFEGQSMPEILATLIEEKKENPPAATVSASQDKLLASLPDGPIPFPEDSAPRDEKWLRDFVTSFESGEGETPTKEELREFTLALSALKMSPEQLPHSLRNKATPASESDTLSILLTPVAHELSGVFALGNFNGGEDEEIIDRGGIRMHSIDGDGRIVPVEGTVASHPGHQLEPTDFDQDGDLDLLVLRKNGLPDSLLRNEGKGQFRDVTIELGLLAFRDSTAAKWIDYDGDGLMDLLLGSSDHPLELYHQTEGGAFQPVAWDLKLWVPRGIREIVAGDFSGDGKPDFFLGIDGFQDRFCQTTPGSEWSDWRFPDVIAESRIDIVEDSRVTFFDFDADGELDFLCIPPISSSPQLLHNQKEGGFQDITELLELSLIKDLQSAIPIDIDNDGYLDLFCGTPSLEMNRLLWNRGGTALKEISIASGASYLDTPVFGMASDSDRDGTADLLYQNQAGAIRWLESTGETLDYLGISIRNSRIGMRIVAEVRDPDWIVHRKSARIDDDCHILLGIGDAEIVETLSIYPAVGDTPIETREKVAPNQAVTFDVPREPRKRAVAPL